MLTFNSKIVNYGALLLLIYLLYNNYTNPQAAPTAPAAQCHAPAKSAIIEIAPNKSENQRTWLEKFILWFFKDKIEQKQSQSQASPTHKEANGKHN